MNNEFVGSNKKLKMGYRLFNNEYPSKFVGSFKKLISKENYDVVRIIYLYRYLSWFITSIFYMISGPYEPIIYKAGVALSLLIAARLTTDLYIKNRENHKSLKYYIFVETIGITALLLPTGGIGSPFIWYALNPVLVAASFLPFIFSWIYLFFYIISALTMSFLFFNYENLALLKLMHSNSNNILVLILITLMVGLLSTLTRQLKEKTKELQCKREELENTNKMLEDNLENIMSLYQIVEAFCNQDNIENFLNAFTEYIVKLTKTNSAFFWMMPYEDKDSVLAVNNIKVSHEVLGRELEELWSKSSNLKECDVTKLIESDFLIISVKSKARCFGFMGIGVEDYYSGNEYNQKLNFLAELSAVILERFYFQEIADKLLLIDEQNRIANEIHDSVSQRIFSITCALHSIKSKWENMSYKEIEAEINLVNDAAKNAMKELRFAIYGLSYKKRGEKIFEENIRSYLNEISNLNNITIKFALDGDADSLSSELKKILHRIICEAAGNALRHGKCKNLKVSLIISKAYVELSAIDDGIGFKTENNGNGSGLGIYNMNKMVQAYNGKLDIISGFGEGTKIYISIPINIAFNKKEVNKLENCNCG